MKDEQDQRADATKNKVVGTRNARARRRWPWALALAVGGLLALSGVLLLPSVQRFIVLRLFPSGPNASLEFTNLHVGPRGASARDLRLEWHGLKVQIDELDASFRLLGLATRRTARVDRLHVSGLVVDVRSVEHDEKQDAGEPFRFEGLLPFARLPVRAVVSEMDVDGELLATMPSGRTARLHAALSGRDIAPGTTGTLSAEVSLRLESAEAAQAVLAGTGSLRVHESDEGVLDRLDFRGEVRPADPGALEGEGLVAQTSIDLTAADEAYRLAFSTTGSAARDVIDLRAARKASDGHVAGSWTAHLDAGQANPYLGDIAPPEFAMDGTGTFDVDPVARTAATVSKLVASAARWDRIDPELAAIGPLRIDADVAADLGPARVDIRTLTARLSPAGSPPVLEIAADQPFRVDTKARTFEPAHWGAPLLHLRLSDVPATWWGGSGTGVVPFSGTLRGAVEWTADDARRFRARSSEPLILAGVRLHTTGRDLGPLSVRVGFDANLAPDAFHATLAGCRADFASGGSLLFDGSVDLPRDGHLRATLGGDLAAHLVQLTGIIPQVDLVRARGTFGLDVPAATLSLVDGAVSVASGNGRKLVEGTVSTVRPLVVDLHDFRPRWSEFEPDSLRLRVDGFPIAWVSRYLPQIRIESGTLHGELHATIPPDRSVRITGDTPFEVRDTDLYWGDLPVLAGARLEVTPSIVLSKTSIDVELKPISFRDTLGNRFEGTLRVSAPPERAADATFRANLRAFAPSLTNRVGNLGDFEFHAAGSFDGGSNALRLESAGFDCRDPDGRSYLNGTSLQPFAVALSDFRVTPSTDSNDLFRATFVPLEFEKLFPEALGFKLQGPLPSGEALISADEGGILFHTLRPLEFGPVTVDRNGAPFLDKVRLTFLPEVAYSTTGVRSRETRIEISSGGNSIATIETRGVFNILGVDPERRIEATVEAALPALFEQPVGKGLPGFDRGTLAASWRVILGSSRSADVRFALSDVARSDGIVAPDFEVQAHLKEDKKGAFRLDAPIRLVAPGRTSDLTASGQLRVDKDENVLELSLDSNRIVVEDVAQLATAFLPPGTGAQAPTASGTAQVQTLLSRFGSKAGVPLWDRVHGKVPIHLRSVEFDRYALQDIRATVQSSRQQLAIEDIGAAFLGARLTGRAAVTFDGSGTAPSYGVAARLGIADVDLGKMFTTVDPSSKPTIEGRFQLDGSIGGSGPDPVVALFESHGEILAEGKDGVFRGLVPGAKTGSRLVRAAGALTFSKELRATGRLIGQLQEIKLREARVRLERDPSRGLILESLDVRSDGLVVHGSGSVRRERGVPLVDRDLRLDVGLAASGDAAIVFDGLGLLGTEADERGFRPVTQAVNVGGTVATPDASALWEALDDAAANAKGSFGWSLRKAMKMAQPTNPGSASPTSDASK